MLSWTEPRAPSPEPPPWSVTGWSWTEIYDCLVNLFLCVDYLWILTGNFQTFEFEILTHIMGTEFFRVIQTCILLLPTNGTSLCIIGWKSKQELLRRYLHCTYSYQLKLRQCYVRHTCWALLNFIQCWIVRM